MGNDGGSIPTRRELVKEAARNATTTQVKEVEREQQQHSWTTCPLSHKELVRPIVSDSGGNLYNKDAVLKYLLPGDEVEGISSKADCEEFLQGRIKGLRDVVELKFENEDGPGELWTCPVTSKSLGPNVKSVYVVPCGHTFSEEAIREMKTDKCLQCNESFEPENIIPILPTKSSDKERLTARTQKLAEEGLTHSLKKAPGSKKRKKNGKKETATSKDTGSSDVPASKPNPTSISRTSTPLSASNKPAESGTSTPASMLAPVGIKNSSTAMLTAKVLEEEQERHKKRKVIGRNENLQSLFSNSGNELRKNGDFMTRGYTIPSDATR